MAARRISGVNAVETAIDETNEMPALINGHPGIPHPALGRSLHSNRSLRHAIVLRKHRLTRVLPTPRIHGFTGISRFADQKIVHLDRAVVVPAANENRARTSTCNRHVVRHWRRALPSAGSGLGSLGVGSQDDGHVAPSMERLIGDYLESLNQFVGSRSVSAKLTGVGRVSTVTPGVPYREHCSENAPSGYRFDGPMARDLASLN